MKDQKADKVKINKYEIILDNTNGFEFKALRHGEEWRDLVGDNLILQMFYEILQLKEENEKLKNK